MLGIDTNLVVRYLTGDHPVQSARARELIDGQAVFVPVTVVMETEWVLRGAYGFAAKDVIQAIRTFAGLTTVTVEDEAGVAAALDLAASGLDFADALHLVRSAHCSAFASFDRKFLKRAKSAGYANVEEA